MSSLRNDLQNTVVKWMDDWNAHDLQAVMELFHDDAVFISWTGQQFKGKRSIRRAWTSWFKNHGDFYFAIDFLAIDEPESLVTFGWHLLWPSRKPAQSQKKEILQGVDILHFKDRQILTKQSFCQTVVSTSAQDILRLEEEKALRAQE